MQGCMTDSSGVLITCKNPECINRSMVGSVLRLVRHCHPPWLAATDQVGLVQAEMRPVEEFRISLLKCPLLDLTRAHKFCISYGVLYSNYH